MKKEKEYEVSVWQEYGGYVRVIAENEKEAIEKAQEMLEAGEISLERGGNNIRITHADEAVMKDVTLITK